jgi:hypothetical protein
VVHTILEGEPLYGLREIVSELRSLGEAFT